jgi:hypothetical protein
MPAPGTSLSEFLTKEQVKSQRTANADEAVLDRLVYPEAHPTSDRTSAVPLGEAPPLPVGSRNREAPVAAEQPVDFAPVAALAGGATDAPVTPALQDDIQQGIQQNAQAFRDYAGKYAELEDLDADDRRTEMVKWLGEQKSTLSDPRNTTYAKALNDLIRNDDAPVSTFQDWFGDPKQAVDENADRFARLQATKALRLGPTGRQIQTSASLLSAGYEAEISTNDLYNKLVEDYESAQLNEAANKGQTITNPGIQAFARQEAVRLAKAEVDRVKAVAGADLFSMTADVDALAEQQEEAADALVPAVDLWQARLTPRGIRMDGPLPTTMDSWDKAKIKGASGLGILGQYLDAFDPMEIGADVLKVALQEKERERAKNKGEGTFKSDIAAPYLAAAAGTAMVSPTTAKTTEWMFDLAQGAIDMLPDDARTALLQYVPDKDMVNRVQRNMVAAAVDEQDMFDAATDTIASLVPGMDPKTGRAVAREYAGWLKTAALAGAIAVPGPDLLSGAAKGLKAGASKVLREAAIKKVDRVADALDEVVKAADGDPELNLGKAMADVSKDRRLTDSDRALVRARIAGDFIDAAAKDPALIDEQIDTLEKIIGLESLKTGQGEADEAMTKLAEEILGRQKAFAEDLAKAGDDPSSIAAAVLEAEAQRVAPPAGSVLPGMPKGTKQMVAEALDLVAEGDVPAAFTKVSEWFTAAGRYAGHLDELAESMDDAAAKVGEQLQTMAKAQGSATKTTKSIGDQARALMLQVQNAPQEVQDALQFLADFRGWRELSSIEDAEKSPLFQAMGGDWNTVRANMYAAAKKHKDQVDNWVASLTDQSILIPAKTLVELYDKQQFSDVIAATANRKVLQRSQAKAARTASRVRAQKASLELAQNEVLANIQAAGGALGKLVGRQLATKADTSLLAVAKKAAEAQRHASRKALASQWRTSMRGHVETLRRGTQQLRERSVGARDLIWRTGMKADDLATLQAAQEAIGRGVGAAAVGERAAIPEEVMFDAFDQVVKTLSARGFDGKKVESVVSDALHQLQLSPEGLSVQQVRKITGSVVGRLFAERKDETAYQLALLAAQSRGASRVRFLEPLRKFLDPALSYIGVGSKNLVAAYRAGDEILTGYQGNFATVVERVVNSKEMKEAADDNAARELFLKGMDEFFSSRGDHVAGIPADSRTILQRAYAGLFDSNPAVKGPALDPELEMALGLQSAKDAAAKAVDEAVAVSEKANAAASAASKAANEKVAAVNKSTEKLNKNNSEMLKRGQAQADLAKEVADLEAERVFEELVEKYIDAALNTIQAQKASLPRRQKGDPSFDASAFRSDFDKVLRQTPGGVFAIPPELRAGDVNNLVQFLNSRKTRSKDAQTKLATRIGEAKAKQPSLKAQMDIARQNEQTLRKSHTDLLEELKGLQAAEAATKAELTAANQAWMKAKAEAERAASEFDSLPTPLRKRLDSSEVEKETDPLIEQLARSLFSGVQAQDLDAARAQQILSGAAKAVLRSPERPDTFSELMQALKAQVLQRFQGNTAVLDDRFVRSTVFLGSVLLQAATRDAVAQAALRNAVAVTDPRSARAINKLLLASTRNGTSAPMAGTADLAKAIEDMLRMGYRLGRTKEGVAAEFGGKVLGGGREGAQLSVAVSEATQQALDSGVWLPANLTDALASSAEVLYKELDKLPTVNPNAVGAAFYGAARGVFGLWRTKVLVGLGINPLGYRFRTLFGDTVALTAYLGPKYGIQHAASAVPQFVPFKGQQALKASFRAAAWAEAVSKPWLDPAALNKYPEGFRRRVLQATQKMLSPAVSAFFQLYPKEIGEVLAGKAGDVVKVGDTEATVGQWFEEMKRQSVFDNNVETGLHTAMQEAGQAMEDALVERTAKAELSVGGLDLTDANVAATKARPNSAAARTARLLRKMMNRAKRHQRGLESSEAQVAKQQRAVTYLSLRRSGFSESEAGELLRDNLMDWRLGVNRAMATLTAWSPFARYHILDQRRTAAALFSGDWLAGKTPWRRASLLMKYESSLGTETGYTEEDLERMVEDLEAKGMTSEEAVNLIATEMLLEAFVPRWAQGKPVDYEALTADQLQEAQSEQNRYDFQMRPQGYYHVRRSSGLREGFDLAVTTAQIMAVAYHQMVGEDEVAADWMLKVATPWLDRVPDVISAEVYRRMSAGDAALEAMYGNQDSGGLFSTATPQEAYVAGVLSNWVGAGRPFYSESEREKMLQGLAPGRLSVPRDTLLAIRAFDTVFPLAMQGVNAAKYRNPEYFDRWNSGTDAAEFAWGALSALWGLDRAYAADPHVVLQMQGRMVAKEAAAAAKSAQRTADGQTRASPRILGDLTNP